MTQQPSPSAQAGGAASLPMDGLGNSPTPTKQLGAFNAPEVVPATATTSAIKPSTSSMSLNTDSGEVSAAVKLVNILKGTQFSQPVTVVKASNPSTAPERAVATFIQDGDTATLKRGDNSLVNCRVDGINAPETAHKGIDKSTGKPYDKPAQIFGEESKKILQNMIKNKEVTVQVSYAKDKYGRNICQIDIAGKNVSQEMVKAGAAWMYTKYSKDGAMSAIQTEAKANKRGLWADPSPINPELFGRMQEFGK